MQRYAINHDKRFATSNLHIFITFGIHESYKVRYENHRPNIKGTGIHVKVPMSMHQPMTSMKPFLCFSKRITAMHSCVYVPMSS